MKLTGPEGEFELQILDYEYTDAPSFLDRNWLLVNLRTHYQGREHTCTASLLSTWEIEMLLGWMQSVVSNRELAPKVTFVEPSLSISNESARKDKYEFCIKLAGEATPAWYEDHKRPFWLKVSPDPQELKGAIQDLKGQLEQFPVRE
ncbi:hypothetical protein GCM10023189_04880 [Nibrella saemangeumensis]|uniref:Uncharacterized protein n=1 Tax=Nibrella saemangeumensis TaxID=1084526 RepID=A0ABP8MBH0_9BACT